MSLNQTRTIPPRLLPYSCLKQQLEDPERRDRAEPCSQRNTLRKPNRHRTPTPSCGFSAWLVHLASSEAKLRRIAHFTKIFYGGAELSLACSARSRGAFAMRVPAADLKLNQYISLMKKGHRFLMRKFNSHASSTFHAFYDCLKDFTTR